MSCYRDRLGFSLDVQYEDFYAVVSRGDTHIHLKRLWQCNEFWVMEDDGFNLAFSEPTA